MLDCDWQSTDSQLGMIAVDRQGGGISKDWQVRQRALGKSVWVGGFS